MHGVKQQIIDSLSLEAVSIKQVEEMIRNRIKRSEFNMTVNSLVGKNEFYNYKIALESLKRKGTPYIENLIFIVNNLVVSDLTNLPGVQNLSNK